MKRSDPTNNSPRCHRLRLDVVKIRFRARRRSARAWNRFWACLFVFLGIGFAAQGFADVDGWNRYSELGQQALQAEDYDKAHTMFEAALREAEQISPWDIRVGHSLNDLAATLYAQGRHADVAALLTRSLRVIEVGQGEDHPDVAQVLKNLAAVEYLQNDHTAAESHLLRALEIWEARLGGENKAVAATLNNLAGIYEAQGRHAEAAAALERSLLIWEKLVGPDHEAVTESRRQLAELQRVHGLLPTSAAQATPAPQEVRERSSETATAAPTAWPEPAGSRLEVMERTLETEYLSQASEFSATPLEATTDDTLLAKASSPKLGLLKLHLGSFRSKERAEDKRSRFLRDYRQLLAALELWVERVQVGTRGDFYRVMAGPVESASVAQDVCSELLQRRQDCFLR